MGLLMLLMLRPAYRCLLLWGARQAWGHVHSSLWPESESASGPAALPPLGYT